MFLAHAGSSVLQELPLVGHDPGELQETKESAVLISLGTCRVWEMLYCWDYPLGHLLARS